MFFVGHVITGNIGSSGHRGRPASTKILLAPPSFLFLSSSLFIFHPLHSKWPSESFTVCLYVLLSVFDILCCS
jgi:hypothetical protein